MLIIQKAIYRLVLSVLCAALLPTGAALAASPVSARSAIVMHSGGSIVYSKNIDDRRAIASTTKLMTALVAAERCELDEMVAIEPEYCGVEGSSMYLEPGQGYSVKELLHGLILASGNDAAVALAYHAAGGIAEFAELMNGKAAELGMTGSHFENPHGLDSPGHYSTARDMAVLMNCFMDNASLAAIAGTKSAEVGELCFENHNRLLRICPGCIGGKTGYTGTAGRCLVSCCERDGTRFVCVTLSDPNDWQDHMRLYDWSYGAYSERDPFEGVSFDVPVVSGDRESVKVCAEPGEKLLLPRSAEIVLTARLPRFEFAPVRAGDWAGEIKAECGGELVALRRLVYAADVDVASRM